MTHVRVCLRLTRWRLEFDGSQEFFERVVEPLLGRIPAADSVALPAEWGASASAPAAAEAPGSQAPARAAPGSPGGGGNAAAGYRPPPHEFGQFVQKLGPEAAAVDRQIVAFIFFLWNYAKKDVVLEDEVDGCFRAIGLKPPVDARPVYEDLAQRLRFLQPGAAPGSWSLTTKGANYVKTRLLGSL